MSLMPGPNLQFTDANVLFPAWRGEERSSFPDYWAESTAYQQERVGCVIICQACLWKGACRLQRLAPAGPAKGWLPDSACSFSCHGVLQHLYHWAGLHSVISRSQSLFLLLVIMRCTKERQGER